MMRKTISAISAIAVLLLSLSACGQSGSKDSVAVADKLVDLKLNNNAAADGIQAWVDSVSFVPLRITEDDSFFKQVNKCVVSDSCIFLLDYFGNSVVTAWKLDGTFLFKVGQQGGGPGEYNRITDIDVANGHIYLLDSSRSMILSYDMRGDYQKTYSYRDKLKGVNDLIVTTDSCFMLGMDVELNDENQVILTDKEFNVKNVLLTFDEQTTRGHLNIGCFKRCGSRIVYYYPVSDHLYEFTLGGELSQVYNIAYGSGLPLELRKDYQRISNAKRDGKLTYFFETPFWNGNLLLSTIYSDSKKALFCADVQRHIAVKYIYDGVEPEISLSVFNFPIYMDDDRVISALDPFLYNYLDDDSKRMLGDENGAIMQEGDVLLAIYHLKKAW